MIEALALVPALAALVMAVAIGLSTAVLLAGDDDGW